MAAGVVAAAWWYAASAFAVGFVLGTVRVLVVVPALGSLGAVAAEIPLMLAASWRLAGGVRGVPSLRQRLAVGLLAFLFLQAMEFGLAMALTRGDAAAYVATLETPHGALGLAAQAVFAVLPALRRPPERKRASDNTHPRR